MSIRIHIKDLEEDIETDSELQDGDFTIIATKPCYVKGMDYKKDGTVLIVVKNFIANDAQKVANYQKSRGSLI